MSVLFKGNFEVPSNFEPVGPIFKPKSDSVSGLGAVPKPLPQQNPQTVAFCAMLGINDPITLVDATKGAGSLNHD